MPVDLLGLTLGTSFASGLNVYAVLATAGLFQRLGWVDLPPALEVLAHPLVLSLSAVMFLVEFVADKVPYLDNIWDAVHTFIRPAAAVILAVGALGTLDPAWQAAGGLVSGTIALAAHGAKASARVAVNATPEPVSNATLSLGEDASAIGLTWLAIAHPVAAAIVAVVLLVLAVWLIHRYVSFVRDRMAAVSRFLRRGNGTPGEQT